MQSEKRIHELLQFALMENRANEQRAAAQEIAWRILNSGSKNWKDLAQKTPNISGAGGIYLYMAAKEVFWGALAAKYEDRHGRFSTDIEVLARLAEARIAGHIMRPALTFVGLQENFWRDYNYEMRAETQTVRDHIAISKLEETLELLHGFEKAARQVITSRMKAQPFIPHQKTVLNVAGHRRNRPLSALSVDFIVWAFAD